VAFRGPLPRYLPASIAELRENRAGLPGVSRRPTADPSRLSIEEVDDIHIPLSVAEAVIAATSRPGSRVLDPFAGYGTTLLACENLGRKAVGVELLPEHVRICRKRAPRSEVIEGDARGVGKLVAGPIDLCFTAPPFLTKNDHPTDPLTGYELEGGDYEDYLTALVGIAAQVCDLLVPGGYLVMNAANIRFRHQTTSLAWDIAGRVDAVLPFIAETAIVWDEMPHDFTGDYLLVFRKPT